MTNQQLATDTAQSFLSKLASIRHHQIKRAYILALAVMALFGIIVWVILMHIASVQQNTVDDIALNTNQRKYLQRVSLILSLLVIEDESLNREVLLDELDILLAFLEQGHADLVAMPMPSAVSQVYFEIPNHLDGQLKDYIDLARTLQATPPTQWLSLNTDFERILELNSVLRNHYDAIIAIFDGVHQAQVSNLQGMALVILGSLFVLLAFEALFIFRPMELAIRHHQAELEAEIARRQQVELSLRQSQTSYRLLVQHLPNMAVLIYDQDLRYRIAEGSALEAVGYTPERIEGKTLLEVVSPSNYQILEPHYRNALNGTQTILEYPFRGRDYITHFLPVYNDTHQVIAGMVVSQDVTEQKNNEQTLKRNAETQRMILDGTRAGTWQWTISTGETVFNARWAEIVGYTLEELAPITIQTWLDLVNPDDLLKSNSLLQKHFSGETPYYEFEVRMKHKQGHWVWVLDRGMVMSRTPDGTPLMMFGTHIDITTLKNTEESLRVSEAHFRSITENANDMIVLLDANFAFVYANPNYKTALGYEPTDLIGQPSTNFIHPADVALVQQRFEIQLPNQKSDIMQFRHLHVDGHYIWVEAHATILTDEQNTLKNVLVVLRDLTERHKLETMRLEQERLETVIEKERELSDLKSRMMTRIAHEFRTPLSIISLSIESLEKYYERYSPEQRLAKRKAITRQIRHITHMLDDIGLVVNGNYQPQNLHVTSLNMTQVCRQIIDEIEVDAQQSGRFSLTSVTDTQLMADQYNLHRALYEVFMNALRFSPNNTLVQVDVTVHEGKLQVCVMDEGIGILDSEQSRIFEPFFRGSNINEVGGLGLGLTLAHEIVLAHQGTIAIYHNTPVGTTVQITLPL